MNAGQHITLSAVIREGRRFRLLKAGIPVLEGYIVGKFKGPEPLEEYGTLVGCTDIEYEQDGYWVTLGLARLAPRSRGLASAV